MNKNTTFSFKAKVWLYKGNGPWHFVTISRKVSTDIKKFETWPPRGFGSIPVKVQIGNTTWKTSIFWEKKGTYMLPIKKEVRAKEDIMEGSIVKIILEVLQ